MAKTKRSAARRRPSAGTRSRPGATSGSRGGRASSRSGGHRDEQRRLAVRLALGTGGVLIVGMALTLWLGVFRTGSPTSSPQYAPIGIPNPSSLPGLLTGAAPWAANTADLRARLRDLGLPALASEGTALHIHQHLDLYVKGRRVAVPAGIGIGGTLFAPVHTHDASGVIHVESPVQVPYTLGQFFDIWGVRFTRSCLGAYCSGGGASLKVWVDGHLVTGNPRQVQLLEHEEIVVAFGTPAEMPNPVLRSWAFAAGL